MLTPEEMFMVGMQQFEDRAAYVEYENKHGTAFMIGSDVILQGLLGALGIILLEIRDARVMKWDEWDR